MILVEEDGQIHQGVGLIVHQDGQMQPVHGKIVVDGLTQVVQQASNKCLGGILVEIFK